MNNLILTDKDTSNLIKEVSTTFGIKSYAIQEIFNYMAFIWITKLIDNPNQLTSITIPYIGSIGLRLDNESVNSKGDVEYDISSFVSLTDAFKDLYSDINNGETDRVVDYLKNHYFKALV